MIARAPIVVALFLIWLILAASYDLAHVVLGGIVAVGVMWLNPPSPVSPFRNVSWWGLVGYLPWLFVRVLKSGLHLSRLILDPALPIAPRLIQHQSALESDGEVVILGNSITLTPGTITVEVSSGELVVHTIDDLSSRDLTDGTFERKISRMFRRGRATR